MHHEKIYDVIVAGVGSMGAATCYYLAKQGINVLGIEQFEIPNELGSHAGQSRLIRKAYYEHPDYVPLLNRAYENWKELESVTGSQVYFETGIFYAGPPEHPVIKGVHESAAKYDIRLDKIENPPGYASFKIPDSFEFFLEPGAGFITPERAIVLYTELAIEFGATIITKTNVNSWQRRAGIISVDTNNGTIYSKKLVITSGAWAGKLLPGIKQLFRVTKQFVAWVIPKNRKQFEWGNFPCWIIADDVHPGIFYGFPMLPAVKFGGPVGLKLAYHFPGEVIEPDRFNRQGSTSDEKMIWEILHKYFSAEFKYIHVLKSCLYTNTPDDNFIIDFVPGYDNEVITASGFSGHGFKFASVVGEIICEMATMGKINPLADFLSINRLLK